MLADHDALRVTVLPVEVAYTISRPARSTVVGPTFVISANSSDAEAPPVWTSETRRVDTGQDTAARATGAGFDAAAKAAPPTDSTTTSPARGATRRSTIDLRAGASEAGRDGRGGCSSHRLSADYPRITRGSRAARTMANRS